MNKKSGELRMKKNAWKGYAWRWWKVTAVGIVLCTTKHFSVLHFRKHSIINTVNVNVCLHFSLSLSRSRLTDLLKTFNPHWWMNEKNSSHGSTRIDVKTLVEAYWEIYIKRCMQRSWFCKGVESFVKCFYADQIRFQIP